MTLFDPHLLKNYPLQSGVYLMRDADKDVLYVGKAKNIQSRLKQYFEGHDTREMIPFLLQKVVFIDTILTFSEKEALLLENTLIKKHQPKYNALLKDDKMYVSLLLTTKHPWPMLKLVRHQEGGKKEGLYFGPYTNALAARETFDMLTRLFPLRQCSDQELTSRKRPCLLYSIKRCLAPCVGICTKEDYNFYVNQTTEFLKGHDKTIVQALKKEMEKASSLLEFEKAHEILKMIKRLEMFFLHSKSLVYGHDLECDVIGYYRGGADITIVIISFRGGKLTSSDHFDFSNCLDEMSTLLEHFLLQYYVHNVLPKEILVPFVLLEKEALSEILFDEHRKTPQFVCPEKGEKKELIKLAEQNAKALFIQKITQEEKQEQYLLELQRICELNRFPTLIECFDTSNLSGSNPVASLITFRNGKKESKGYRSYKIKGNYFDDYACLKEILSRRYKKEEQEKELPDLIIVDGGKGQLNVAEKILKELGIASSDLIALTKEQGRHDKGLSKEKIYITQKKEPILLERDSPVLFLLQQIRDEAHRRAIQLQKKQREKKLLSSPLDRIPGIGPAKKKALLKAFGSVKKIFEASEEDLLKIKCISNIDCKNICFIKDKYF